MRNDTLVLAMHEVLKAVRMLKQRHNTAVPVGALGVLAAIRNYERAGPCHMKDLAAEHALDPSTISRAVAALVRAGLVTRVADPADGRASTLHLTDQGRTVLDSAQKQYETRLTTALQDWSAEEIADFTSALRRFAHDLIVSSPGHSPGDPFGLAPNETPSDSPSLTPSRSSSLEAAQ
ncbi:MarR family winged helix-turn-helix transcriptional regulator [Actinoplanes sp. NBC_00393]|uniref:MarR family winged helix-turn-helix transcriptional regulator n=1 Tax=Actinoplanes sp. NBC_00393 TaxID=2975953 RepID=UPI002E1B4EDE